MKGKYIYISMMVLLLTFLFGVEVGSYKVECVKERTITRR